jgi:hypothetical protein
MTRGRWLAAALVGGVLAAVTASAPATAAPPSDGPRHTLDGIVQNVTGSTAHRYGATDSAGHTMDTAKIVQDPTGGYLAVYHTYVSGTPHVFVATSTDVLTWTYRADLGSQASQPYLAATSGGHFVVAWEQEPGNHLAFRYYASHAALLAGTAARSYDAPQTLSTCAEGTPNIYSVTLSPDIDHSTIDVGGHYYRACDVDRQQRGTLTNFGSWKTSAQSNVDNAMLYWGVQGNIGDRDSAVFQGYRFGLFEGQYTKGDFGSWRVFVYDYQTGNADTTTIHTDGGSTAFANPGLTEITAPNGAQALVITLFLPSEGASAGESGELIYYTTY